MISAGNSSRMSLIVWRGRNGESLLLSIFGFISDQFPLSLRPACAPLHSNQYQHSPLSSSNLAAWGNSGPGGGGGGGTTTNSHHLYNSSQYHSPSQKSGHHATTTIRDADGNIIRKEKRQYRKRKHKLQKEKGMQSSSSGMMGNAGHGGGAGLGYSSAGHHLHHLSGESDF